MFLDSLAIVVGRDQFGKDVAPPTINAATDNGATIYCLSFLLPLPYTFLSPTPRPPLLPSSRNIFIYFVLLIFIRPGVGCCRLLFLTVSLDLLGVFAARRTKWPQVELVDLC